jgi:hypothetical protein
MGCVENGGDTPVTFSRPFSGELSKDLRVSRNL